MYPVPNGNHGKGKVSFAFLIVLIFNPLFTRFLLQFYPPGLPLESPCIHRPLISLSPKP